MNSIMVAAFLASRNNIKVSIFDLDAHFAGGSQEVLLNSKNSEFAKNIHQVDFYISLYDKKIGEKAKLANYEIVLLPDKIDDKTFLYLLENSLKNAEKFSPRIIFVNSGYDLASDDAEGGNISPIGYYEIYNKICELASKLNLPIICALEAGYSNSLGLNVAYTISSLGT